MSGTPAHMGHGLYFIDVLACLLFALALAVSVARFDPEFGLDVTLPESPAPEAMGAALTGLTLTVREGAEGPSVFVEDDPVPLDALEERLRELAPPQVVVRSEATALARVIALAHAAGVAEIRLAYRLDPHSPRTEEPR